MKPIDRVLLIDDEEIDQRQYRRVIERSGLVQKLIVQSYADEALEFLSATEEKISAIFLDINMPRMNGFEFLESFTSRVGKSLESVVIIMLTTSLNPLDRERALSFDIVQGFVNKPLELKDIESVAKLVSDKSQGQTWQSRA